MAVVVLENDYSPPAQGYYFRQEAWSEFNGTRLVASTIEGADEDTLAEFPTRETAVEAPPEGSRARVAATVAMLVDHQHPFALESPLEFEPIRNPNPERFTRAYKFESLAQEIEYGGLLGRETGNPEWSDELRAMYLETHADPRFAELAEQILATELPERMRNDPFARALAIKLYLDRELVYSTRERHANVDDPTVDFLFGNRIGYCVHFSHSAVLLFREAGVPARIGTGYMVPEENRRGGSSILVRSADAHAWPEVYVKDVGWVVLDIAAERNLDEPGQPLDEDLQRMLGEMAREEEPNPEDEVAEPEDEEPFDLGIELWVLLAILAGAALAILYLVKVFRRVRPVFARGRTLARVAYRAYLDRLAEVGLARELGETREAFAVRVATVAPSFAKMTELHVASRLSDPMKDARARKEWDPGEWRALAKAMRTELSSHVKLWRRVVGWLHPVSFLDSR
jgi:transglutaminase-like putative cysteine protease